MSPYGPVWCTSMSAENLKVALKTSPQSGMRSTGLCCWPEASTSFPFGKKVNQSSRPDKYAGEASKRRNIYFLLRSWLYFILFFFCWWFTTVRAQEQLVAHDTLQNPCHHTCTGKLKLHCERKDFSRNKGCTVSQIIPLMSFNFVITGKKNALSYYSFPKLLIRPLGYVTSSIFKYLEYKCDDYIFCS